jgi:hypothetical protein
MRIDSNGNLGINQASIGTEAHPDTKLYVTGALTFGEVAFASQASLPAIVQSSSDGAAQDLTIGTRSATGSVRFFTGAVDTAGDFGTNGSSEAMRIDAKGNTTFTGSVTASGPSNNSEPTSTIDPAMLLMGASAAGDGGELGFGSFGKKFAAIKGAISNASVNGTGHLDFYTRGDSDNEEMARALRLDKGGDATFSGTVTVEGNRPVSTKLDLITTLVTLRKATMDETQDIRESLRDAIDELVAGFEQEIAAMPAPEPEASTMDMVDE